MNLSKLTDFLPALSPAAGSVGVIGAAIAAAFGGWDTGLVALLIAMAIDYITGLLVAGVFKASPKTKDGALESRAGWKGLCRKGMTMLIVLIAAELDRVLGTSVVRDAVVLAYLATECVSIIENAGLMGVPIPGAITKAIEILRERSEEGER